MNDNSYFAVADLMVVLRALAFLRIIVRGGSGISNKDNVVIGGGGGGGLGGGGSRSGIIDNDDIIVVGFVVGFDGGFGLDNGADFVFFVVRGTVTDVLGWYVIFIKRAAVFQHFSYDIRQFYFVTAR